MIPSDSSQAKGAGDGVPANAKRSKPEDQEDQGGKDAVLRPVKLSRTELYKPPTVEELHQLKEAESLFHCSLLKMQVCCQPSPKMYSNECCQTFQIFNRS